MMTDEQCSAILGMIHAFVGMPNAETLAAIDDAEHGRNLSGPFETVDALMEDLNADD